ncbi:MAG: hypothetical protein OEV59_09620 [Deltaproteobacteria bacterium]|nr:hypothetical protein [Deltaproteobacteria bacterium]
MSKLKELILRNAEEIRRIDARIHETVAYRDESKEKHMEWSNACAEFHARYDKLAFPGGYEGACERMLAGEEEAMEAAICFLECRPYFFRSGYMTSEILRKIKKAPLSDEQRQRLNAVLLKREAYRQKKVKAG